jgi:glycosyltransferase involved in cell wall biosynthesis
MHKKNHLIRLLIIIPSLAGGGAEHALINLLKKIDYSRFNVDLCVGVGNGVYFNQIPSSVNVRIIFKYWWSEKILIFLNRHVNAFMLNRLVARRKIKEDYEVGVSFIDGFYTDLMLSLGNQIIKTITWIHASYVSNINYFKYYHGRYFTRLVHERYNKLDTIVFVSEDCRSEFQRVFGHYPITKVIYNIIDPDEIKNKANEDKIVYKEFDKINIIALGNLYPVKAYDKLIYVARKLKDDNIHFKIRILGSGGQYNVLKNLINKLNVEDCVELMVFRLNPYPYLKSSDIYIMTSLSEALPTALCEAMILGLPCIVTDSSGSREITAAGHYGMMTGNAVEDIYSGLKELILNKDLREDYSRKSLERVTFFDDSISLKEIHSILLS